MPTRPRTLTLALAALVAALGVALARSAPRPPVVGVTAPGPAALPPPPAAVDPTFFALLTADDVARGLLQLASLPDGDPAALTPAQREALAPRLAAARAARAEVGALRERRRAEALAAAEAGAALALALPPAARAAVPRGVDR